MYYISPVTYLIGGVLSAVLNDVPVVCAPDELTHFNPPVGQTCGTYASDFLKSSLGYLVNPNDSSNCQYCSLKEATGVYLSILKLI
jgi:ABC-type multidrug transport system permease subunit